jgi:hypothetical protein
MGGFWGFVAMTLGGMAWREFRRRGGVARLGRHIEQLGGDIEQYARTDTTTTGQRRRSGAA